MGQHQRRRRAAAITAMSLIGSAIVVGAVSAPGRIVALPGSAESTVVNVDPTRGLDTRFNVGLTGKFQSQIPRKLKVTGPIETYVEVTDTRTTKTVVPIGATGVIMNVTAVHPTATGFLSVRPGTATGLPSTAGLNFGPGDVIPNHISVAIPTTGPNAGRIDLTYVAGTVGQTMDVVVDIVGYTTSSGLADLVTLVGTKADSADVYAKNKTFTKAQVIAEINKRMPVAQSVRLNDIDPDPAGSTIVIASVTLQAPSAGLIQIVGGTWVFNSSGGFVQCYLTLGSGNTGTSGPLADTQRESDVPSGKFGHCATNGAVAVAAGSHVLNLVANAPAGMDLDDTTLDAIFVPGGSVVAQQAGAVSSVSSDESSKVKAR